MKPFGNNSGAALWGVAAGVATIALFAQAAMLLRGGREVETIAPASASLGPTSLPDETDSGIRACIDPWNVSELLVDSIVEIESAGNPRCVGRAGERGLMQIKRRTWEQVTRRLHGRPLPFERAFDAELNRRVGKAYLAELQAFLHRHRANWRSDERSLLLACYNAGPQRVMQAGFNMNAMPRVTRSYVERATALHELFLAEDAPQVRSLLLSRLGSVEDRRGNS
ncbi:MAG: lytic transglycosylase domain-containing protein [Kiritimatiellae bacterium]|nr:lytic transglycosylase domain-containing protein [Kiritimatiellia bacterium]